MDEESVLGEGKFPLNAKCVNSGPQAKQIAKRGGNAKYTAFKPDASKIKRQGYVGIEPETLSVHYLVCYWVYSLTRIRRKRYANFKAIQSFFND